MKLMSVKSQERRVESRMAEQAPPLVELRLLNSGPRPLTLDPCPSRGFTLVELLVTIMIIGILASALLGVAAVASETAREARTRQLISRIHNLILEQYNSYDSRRIDTSELVPLGNAQVSGLSPKPLAPERADRRLLVLRQMMRMEMPDRWSDLLNTTVDSIRPNAASAEFDKLKSNQSTIAQRYLCPPTELWSVYIRRYRQLKTNDPEVIRENQSAECLYMIVMNACADGEARTLFQENVIGDTDGDGAPEFIDGWGHPVNFIRWPAGFSSDMQLGPARFDEIRADAVDAIPSLNPDVEEAKAIAKDHDLYDLFRRNVYDSSFSGSPTSIYYHLRQQRVGYRLVPLIYSAGRDEVTGINDDPTDFSNMNWRSNYLWIDPYAKTLGTNLQLGAFYDSSGDKSWIDNVHNHLIGKK